MPVRWTPEVHEALLVAIMTSGLVSAWSGDNAMKIISAWPKNKGPAPTVSALTQHLDSLRKKCGIAKGAAPKATPSKPTAGNPSVSRSSTRKATKTTTPAASGTEDEEDDEVILKPKQPSIPAPRRRNATLSRATISPSTGLTEKSRKRTREDSPVVDVKFETFLDIDTGDDASANPYADVPMAKRQAAMREDKRKKLYQHSRPAVVEDVEDEEY